MFAVYFITGLGKDKGDGTNLISSDLHIIRLRNKQTNKAVELPLGFLLCEPSAMAVNLFSN